MTDKLIVDKRRSDQRRVINSPYWITSAEIDPLDDGLSVTETECYLLFSFPAVKYGTSIILIQAMAFQVVEAFAGGTITIDIGRCTILTDGLTDGDTITFVDENDLITNAVITYGTPGIYHAGAGDYVSQAASAINGADNTIVPADATVPCVTAYLTNDGTAYTTGKGRLHMLVTEIPYI